MVDGWVNRFSDVLQVGFQRKEPDGRWSSWQFWQGVVCTQRKTIIADRFHINDRDFTQFRDKKKY
jgi:hypothetical protein